MAAIAYDMVEHRPGGLAIQRKYRGSPELLLIYFPDPRLWLDHDTPTMRLFVGTDDEWRRTALMTRTYFYEGTHGHG